MQLHLNDHDRAQWDALCATQEKNDRVTHLLARYLNEMPRFITRRMVRDLAREVGIAEETAYRTLFSAAIGLDTASDADDRQLEKEYLATGLGALDPSERNTDAYLQTISFPTAKDGNWTFCTERYAPYEPFVRNSPLRTPDGKEIPQIGYFAEAYRFPAVRENGVEWMAVKPNEIATMREPIGSAHGNVVAFGLGLGYFAFHASEKADVTSVTIVERDPAVIDLFRRYLLPQFPNREKIGIVQADAFDYAERILPQTDADFAFVDLWHDQSDGLPLYLRFRRLESLSPKTEFSYWIETTILSSLRRMVFDRIRDNGDGEIRSFSEIETMLSDDYLRTLAPKVKKIQ